MFGKKSRLERENDALEEQIYKLESEVDFYDNLYRDIEIKYLRNLREYRYTQKACERRKRANKRLRAMLDDVGWPKNDLKPYKGLTPAAKATKGAFEHLSKSEKKPERLVPRKLP